MATERFEVRREIAATPEKVFALLSDPGGHVAIDSYRLEPVESGTRVTSYYDWSQVDDTYRDKGIFPVIPETALRATLGILARNVE
jgi:hypothetical protein